jgi:hypothetical protein
VKFTPEGGKVEVTLAADSGEAVLSVADTGIGIQAADRERVFERFFRTEAATQRVIPGSGLGLTISRAIVDAHQGTITVRSDGEHGSTFTVRLPLAPEPRALAPQAWAPQAQAVRSGLASGQPPAASRTRATSDSRRLLVRDGPDGLANCLRRVRVALQGQLRERAGPVPALCQCFAISR